MIAAGSLVAILLLWSDDRYHFLWKALLALAFCASVVGTVDGAVALRARRFADVPGKRSPGHWSRWL